MTEAEGGACDSMYCRRLELRVLSRQDGSSSSFSLSPTIVLSRKSVLICGMIALAPVAMSHYYCFAVGG
jgi:hypothetical protein